MKFAMDPHHFCALALAGKLSDEQNKQAAQFMLTGEIQPMSKEFEFTITIKEAQEVALTRMQARLNEELTLLGNVPFTARGWQDIHDRLRTIFVEELEPFAPKFTLSVEPLEKK